MDSQGRKNLLEVEEYFEQSKRKELQEAEYKKTPPTLSLVVFDIMKQTIRNYVNLQEDNSKFF